MMETIWVGVIRYVLVLLAVAGAVVSALALRVHYSTETSACSINAVWDCGTVNHSSFAQIGPLPVAAIGIAGYLVLAGLAWTRKRFLLLLASGGGFIFALRLTMIEQYALGAWCVYCVISQLLIALILLSSLAWFACAYRALLRDGSKISW